MCKRQGTQQAYLLKAVATGMGTRKRRPMFTTLFSRLCFLRAVLSASLAKPFDGGIFSFSCQDQLSNDTQGKGDSLDTTDCLESNLGLMWVKGDPMEDEDDFLEGQGQNKPWGGLLTPICRLPLSKRRSTLIS